MMAEFQISPNDAGQRVERYLRKRFPNLSLDRLQSLFRRKEIKVSRKPVKRSHMLASGDELRVYGLREEEAATTLNTQAPAAGEGTQTSVTGAGFFDIPILHEDGDILVLDKPANLAVHPGTGIAPGKSVIEKVRARLGAGPRGGELFQPSLVHRLDKETSGVLVVAKTGEALRRLTAALREGGFTKRYLALVEGMPDPPEGRIDAALRRVDSRSGGAKAEVDPEAGRDAVTLYRTVKVVGKYSLLSVIIETGKMHQIRAHMAHAGHPVAGDSRYGSHARNRALRIGLGLKRIFLHAAELEISPPGGKARAGSIKSLVFRAPLPEDLSQALDRLPDFDPGLS